GGSGCARGVGKEVGFGAERRESAAAPRLRTMDQSMRTESLITRREAIAMLGAGFLIPQQRGPRGAVIRTLLKDIEPEMLTGPILFHEHLSMHYPPQTPQHFTDDVAMMVDEAKAAKQDGIASIVDGGHPDMSRSLDALKRIATESGLPVVAIGGCCIPGDPPSRSR